MFLTYNLLDYFQKHTLCVLFFGIAKARRANKAKARKKVGAAPRETCDNNKGRIYVIGGSNAIVLLV